jgi:parvulin-like peptidyl-prolyl isomerase
MKKILIVLVVAAIFAVAIYVIRSQQVADQTAGNDIASYSGSEVDQAQATQKGQATQRGKDFGYEQLLLMMGSLNESERDAVLADDKLFNQVISQEALRLSYIDAANASQFAGSDQIQYLLERQTDDFLVNAFIKNRLGAAGVPEGFPSEQQVQQYYEQNKQRFMLAERVPVWQIFWKIADDASKPSVAKLLKKATLLASDIKKGKLSFEQAALTHSQHPASRLQGGYMGMLMTADLRPKIKGPLLALKEGVLSKPIRGENGLHLFKRGPIQPAEMLPLSQIREQVVRELVQALRQQQRIQLNQLVSSEYPVEYSAETAAQWRRKASDYFSKDTTGNPK